MNYIHKVNYYETDKMGITHHSNYIRWMEEARIYYLDNINCNYKKIEDLGIISPVIGLECEYKSSTTFDDSVEIQVKLVEYKGVKFTFEYEMKNIKTNEIVLIGKTRHCFLDKSKKPIILKKSYPELDKKFKSILV